MIESNRQRVIECLKAYGADPHRWPVDPKAPSHRADAPESIAKIHRAEENRALSGQREEDRALSGQREENHALSGQREEDRALLDQRIEEMLATASPLGEQLGETIEPDSELTALIQRELALDALLDEAHAPTPSSALIGAILAEAPTSKPAPIRIWNRASVWFFNTAYARPAAGLVLAAALGIMAGTYWGHFHATTPEHTASVLSEEVSYIAYGVDYAALEALP